MNDLLQAQLVKWVTGVLTTYFATFGGCVSGGCQSAGPLSFEQQLQLVDEIRQVAHETGTAAVATWSFGPNVGLFQRTTIGVDTGSKLQVSLLLNAAVKQPVVEVVE